MMGTMFILNRHIRLITALILCGLIGIGGIGFSPSAVAQEPDFEITVSEQALFDYINQARENPLAMAEAVGLNRADVLANFPGMRDVLKNGMAPLQLQGQLLQTAAAHAQDMITNNYYAYESIDGRTPKERFLAAGYAPAEWGESLGFLFFNNYIAPEKAAFQIFRNMLRDELDPQIAESMNILNPNFSEIGISCKGGIFHFENFQVNAYLVTCDFGYPMKTSELQLLQLINQARADLETVAQSYGVDVAQIINGAPALEAGVLVKSAPPLTPNRNLYHSADAHAQDMLAKEYFSESSPDGRTPKIRIQESGYAPIQWVGENIGRISFGEGDDILPSETASRLFRQIFLNAFDADQLSEEMLFSESAREIGLRIVGGESRVLSGICGDYVRLGVVDYGLRAIDVDADGATLIGIVYQDIDQNGLYDPGEGLAGRQLSLKKIRPDAGKTEVETIITNLAGGFTHASSLAQGVYQISLMLNGEEFKQRLKVSDNRPIWLALPVSATEAPAR